MTSDAGKARGKTPYFADTSITGCTSAGLRSAPRMPRGVLLMTESGIFETWASNGAVTSWCALAKVAARSTTCRKAAITAGCLVA